MERSPSPYCAGNVRFTIRESMTLKWTRPRSRPRNVRGRSGLDWTAVLPLPFERYVNAPDGADGVPTTESLTHSGPGDRHTSWIIQTLGSK